jgi:hypothetical protein
MAFEEFQGKRSHGGEPAVSISKSGNFILNSKVVSTYFSDKKYAKLYWDEQQRKIGIKPVASKDTASYSVNFSPRGGVASFSGTAFLKAHGIPYTETRSIDASWDEKEGLLVLKVD